MNRIGRTFGMLMLATAVAIGAPVTMAAAQPNIVGPVSSAPAICSTIGLTRSIDVAVPVVYSSNLHAGAGNDKQQVAYWTRLVENSSTNPVTNWAYAGTAWANDNQPAALPYSAVSGGFKYYHHWPVGAGPTVRVQLAIRWWDANGGFLGGTDPVVVSYVHPGMGTYVTGSC